MDYTYCGFFQNCYRTKIISYNLQSIIQQLYNTSAHRSICIGRIKKYHKCELNSRHSSILYVEILFDCINKWISAVLYGHYQRDQLLEFDFCCRIWFLHCFCCRAELFKRVHAEHNRNCKNYLHYSTKLTIRIYHIFGSLIQICNGNILWIFCVQLCIAEIIF